MEDCGSRYCVYIISGLPETDKRRVSYLSDVSCKLFFGYYLLEQIRYLIQSMNQLRQYLSIDNIYMESILKMIGITCLGEFTCDFCKDCGQEALGRQISMAARLTILGFSMPIVLAVLKNVSKLM